MAIDFAVLKTEIETDPTALGYAPHVASGSDSEIAAILNLKRSTIRINRELVGAEDLIAAVEWTDYSALTGTVGGIRRDAWRDVLAATNNAPIDPNQSRIAGMIANIWGTSATEANLSALKARDGSRAEQLFGRGIFVTSADVAVALRGR